MGARDRIAAAVRGLFAHVDEDPLAHTMSFPGDPGPFGPRSVTWRVHRHPAVFLAGPRALLVQACHPEVLAGVVDHSRFRDDPLGRLSRTSAWVTVSAFGSAAEIAAAAEGIRRGHRRVRGVSPRGVPYSADDPGHAAWVHNALVDSFLTAYERVGPGLSPADADRYVAEQTVIGALMGAEPLPDTAAGLRSYVSDHPDLGPSPDLAEMVSFLRRPPLPAGVGAGYRILFDAAVGTLPPRLRELTALRTRRGALPAARALVGVLGAALGESPAYEAAAARLAATPGGSGFPEDVTPPGSPNRQRSSARAIIAARSARVRGSSGQ